MGKTSRDKGKGYEREIAKILKKFGFKARRTEQYCGKSGDSSDVVGLPGIHIECKHYKSTGFKYEWLTQAIEDSKDGETPIVVHRTDRNPNVVTLKLEDFIELYKKSLNKNDDDDNEYALRVREKKIPLFNIDSEKLYSYHNNIMSRLNRAGIVDEKDSKKIFNDFIDDYCDEYER